MTSGHLSGEWPVVALWRWLGSDQLTVVRPATRLLSGAMEHETYLPESAPNVLSPEEARLVSLALKSWASPKETALQDLRRRLADYAGKEQQ